jgi:hypothetical protein
VLIQFQYCCGLVMCRSSFCVVEAWSCVDLVSVLLSLDCMSIQFSLRLCGNVRLCVNIGSCGCVLTLDLVPFLMNYFFRLRI